jgi:hypothetical protein
VPPSTERPAAECITLLADHQLNADKHDEAPDSSIDIWKNRSMNNQHVSETSGAA